jgi:hypothetical protein
MTKNVLSFVDSLPKTIPALKVNGNLISDCEVHSSLSFFYFLLFLVFLAFFVIIYLYHSLFFMQIRGEIVMSKNNFAKINAAREAAGQKLFKNARNLVSGMLHLDVSDHVVDEKGETQGAQETRAQALQETQEAQEAQETQEAQEAQDAQEAQEAQETQENGQEEMVEASDQEGQEGAESNERTEERTEDSMTENETHEETSKMETNEPTQIREEGVAGEHGSEAVVQEQEPQLEAKAFEKGCLNFMAYTLVLPPGVFSSTLLSSPLSALFSQLRHVN